MPSPRDHVDSSYGFSVRLPQKSQTRLATRGQPCDEPKQIHLGLPFLQTTHMVSWESVHDSIGQKKNNKINRIGFHLSIRLSVHLPDKPIRPAREKQITRRGGDVQLQIIGTM